MTSLQRAILETVCYFDLLDYPLTLLELQRYLWQTPSTDLATLQATVTTLPQLVTTASWITLYDRTYLVETRQQRYLESQRKWRKRLPYLWLLSTLPFVEALFVVNTLAYHNPKPNSDIDLLIITRPGKIWTTRWFTTTLAKLLRLRPRPNYTKDTLCLSFYLAADHLDLAGLNRPEHNLHQAYWLAQLWPVYDPAQFSQRIWQANPWIQHHLPNARSNALHPLRSIQPSFWHTIGHSWWGQLVPEKIWKNLQLAILPTALKQLSATAGQPTYDQTVILLDTLLKFHTHDPRPQQEAMWQKRLATYSR